MIEIEQVNTRDPRQFLKYIKKQAGAHKQNKKFPKKFMTEMVT